LGRSAASRLAALPRRLMKGARLRRAHAHAASRLVPTSWAVVVALIVILAGTLAYVADTRAAPRWLSFARVFSMLPAAQPTQAVVVRGALGTPTPTVAGPAYALGAWVSNSAPPRSGTVRVYVRMTDYAHLRPVAHVAVTLEAQFTCATREHVATYGPLVTDADGTVAFEVAYAGLRPGQPVCLTAFATAGAQTYTASVTFAPS
jgi:hypothetical protein